MSWTRWSIPVLFVGLLAAPFVLRPGDRSDVPDDARRLIIFTPHNDQIQFEFAAAFDRWHQEHYGERVNVVFNAPGGTAEIRTMLQSQFTAALEQGTTPGGNADLVFGGGTYEHDVLKRGVTAEVDGQTVSRPISAPIRFDQQWLDDVYGENDIGGLPLYDPEGYWFGAALSGFGIVYNRDVLERIGVEEPTGWDDLCHPKLRSWLALVNPGQSGSVTTAFESILQRRGWVEGWRILRRAAANARYFSAQSNRPPTDVSQGDAAMGVCIDFYGRFQAQAIERDHGDDRVGYIDPPGETTIDPDPISMLANAPNPELARRFIAFTLSEQGQALWQLPAVGGVGGAGGAETRSRRPEAGGQKPSSVLRPPSSDSRLGPRRYELRRLPIRRTMYDDHLDSFVDQVNPYLTARPVENPDSAARSFIPVLFAAMAIDSHDDLKAAWNAIVTHPDYPRTGNIVTAADVSDPVLRQMLADFDALPEVPAPDGGPQSPRTAVGGAGSMIPLSDPATLATIRDGWLRGEWGARGGAWGRVGGWPDQADPRSELRRLLGEQFRTTYRRIAATAHATPTR